MVTPLTVMTPLTVVTSIIVTIFSHHDDPLLSKKMIDPTVLTFLGHSAYFSLRQTGMQRTHLLFCEPMNMQHIYMTISIVD
jgi:hypothetical protein